MYHTTGFTKTEVIELCARIEARELSPRMRRWPPILGLRNALTVTLTYMRRNRVQAEIAENYGVSQPTISRAISAITPLLVQALLDYVPTADELDAGTCYVVDGTLLPCWSWRAPATSSNRSSRTSRPGGSCIPITTALATFPETISAVVALGYGARTGSPGKGYETRLPT